MSTLTAQAAHDAVSAVVEPLSARSLAELRAVSDLDVEAGKATLTLRLPPGYPHEDDLRALVDEALAARGAAEKAAISFVHTVSTRDIQGDDPCPGVRNIVLVMSGKGGVGKSTVATNLAMSLAANGARVGLLDADMYGPSIPTMLGVMGRPVSEDGKRMLPLSRFGVDLMSIGFLLEDDKQAVVWRGPMLQGALLQFLKDVDWKELDYLVLDLPPGTGDIALTISQKMRSTGAVVVTTPQQVALQDVYKSVSMAQKVGIPLLGVVENESYFICGNCSERHELFGAGGGEAIAAFAEAPLLGQIPLEPGVREWGDAGTPIVKAAPDASVSQAFRKVGHRLALAVEAENAKRGESLVIDRSGGKNRRLPIAR